MECGLRKFYRNNFDKVTCGGVYTMDEYAAAGVKCKGINNNAYTIVFND